MGISERSVDRHKERLDKINFRITQPSGKNSRIKRSSVAIFFVIATSAKIGRPVIGVKTPFYEVTGRSSHPGRSNQPPWEQLLPGSPGKEEA